MADESTPRAARRSPIALGVMLAAIAAADYALAGRWFLASLGLTGATALLTLPWIAVVLSSDGTRGRARFFWHVANIVFVLSFSTAKVLMLLHMRDADAALYAGSYRSYTVALLLLQSLGLVLRGGAVARLAAASAEHPARLMAFSFGATSLVGALLLTLPVCVHDVTEVSLLDAIFMSTSAVCVTGLAAVNVADTYTLTGQVVLCALMQVGGLGIMVLTTAITMLAGRSLGVKSSAVMAELVDATSLADLKRAMAAIVGYTLFFEACGAGVLYWLLAKRPPEDFFYYSESGLGGSESALWAAVFHSVSAFCNGSLSNFRGGLVPFARSIPFCQAIMALIVLGGVGFPVMDELLSRAITRLRGKRPPRVSLNTRVGLATGVGLFAAVAVLTFTLEIGASFSKLGVYGVNAALFHSACARTSGFNLVDVAEMRPATLLLTCFAMFVGAGPGSTAGGIKTTTLASLFAAFRGELRGERPRLFDRVIGEAVVRRAMGVAFLSTTIVVVIVFFLLLTEKHAPLALLFEVISAFSTTGMSTGITPALTSAGKALVVLTMLIGRVGPLTVALALSARERRPAHELPEERVMIG